MNTPGTRSSSSRLKTWWYAIRPHTLGASIAPMLIVTGALVQQDAVDIFPLILCYIVALSAQIASNIGNDLFDYLDGADTEGRVGFERVLTRGKVTFRQMAIALGIALAVCIVAGVTLAYMQEWWLLAIGVAVVVGVFAYSAGPYPLSYNGLGDMAVVLFFGLVPVLGTYYAVAGTPPGYLLPLALGIGAWEANILVVNNYRDYAEDKTTGKNTLVVMIGEKSGPKLYMFNALLSLLLFCGGMLLLPSWQASLIVGGVALIFFGIGSILVTKLRGKRLNQLLIYTSRISILIALVVMIALIIFPI